MELHVEIGGLSSTLVVPSQGLAQVLRERYSAFLAPPHPQAMVVSTELLGAAVEEGYRPPTISVDGDHLTVSRHDMVASSRDGGTSWHVRILANEYSFDSLLRILYTLRLIREGGFLVHASAQIRHGWGCLFTGKSEAGKSTISRLGEHNVVLCDELPLVRLCNGTYRVWGTPFWGEFGKGRVAASAEVRALFFLNKAPYHRVKPLTPGRALPRLLQTTLFFSRDPAMVEAAMARCADFLSKVPVFDLYFKPDPQVWEVVDEALLSLQDRDPRQDPAPPDPAPARASCGERG